MAPPSTRARTILIALILSDDHAVKRSTLVASIWPESSAESRKVRLRQELANIRSFLATLGCPDSLTVDRDQIRFDISGINIDFITISAALNDFEASPEHHADNVLVLLSQLGNNVVAPELQELFGREQRRFSNRVEASRLHLAKYLLDHGRQQDVFRVLSDILDINPENSLALTLREKAMLTPTIQATRPTLIEATAANSTRIHKPFTRNWPLLAVSIAIASFLIYLGMIAIGGKKTSTTMLDVNAIRLYTDRTERGELPDSEGTSAYEQNGYIAVAGFTKTQQDDSDGITLLLDPSGRLLWRERFHSISHDCDRFFQVIQDRQGNVFSAGESYLTKPEVVTEGWYGRIVSYTRYGKVRFAVRTDKPVANVNGVVRVVPADDGGCWLYTTTLRNKRYFIMATHFSSRGVLVSERLLDDCPAILSDVRAASDGAQHIFGTAEVAAGTAAHRDWYAVKLNKGGETVWSEHLDGPAPGRSDDERCTGILDVKDSVMLYGVMDWPGNGQQQRAKLLSPTIARLDETTGNVIKLTQIPTTISSPLVRCWDIYPRTQVLVVLLPLRDTDAQTIEWYLVHKVTGIIEQKGKISLPNNLTAISTLSGTVTPKGDVVISVSARPNRAGSLPSAVMIATTSPSGYVAMQLAEHLPILKFTSQTNGYVVGQIADAAGRRSLFVTNINAGSRQQ